MPVPNRLALVVSCLLLVGTSPAQVDVHPEELELKPQIDAAIAKGVDHLLKTQHRDGSWGVHGRFVGGKTGLTVYTLLKCGVRPDDPRLQRAFLHLDSIEPEHTYATACMMLAYAATGDPARRERIASLLRRLIDWQKSAGDWGYPEAVPDLSNTQYAALGLWAAHRADVPVPTRAWQELIDGVLKYQESIDLVEAPPHALPPEEEGRTTTSTGRIRVGGFGYRRGTPPTGSMTTAGISCLQIAKLGLGGRLRGRLGREVDEGIEAGLNWLAVNFAVDKNPPSAGWHLYYLYGLERVGSLTRVEQLGTHWWYLDGARLLLEKQGKQGQWGPPQDVDTCFALLFLRRATKVAGGPTTGAEAVGSAESTVFSAGTEKDPVAIRAAGQQPLAVWITGFGEGLQARHQGKGLRVVKVEYFDGATRLAELVGDPQQAWRDDAFAHRCPALTFGSHALKAKVTLLAPGAGPDDEAAVEVVESPEMKVEIREVFAPWMETAATLRGKDLLRGVKIEVHASSQGEQGKFVHDGVDGTAWVCSPDDAEPTLTLELDRPVRAQRLVLAPAANTVDAIGRFDRILEVEVRFNDDGEGVRVRMDPDPIALTVYELPDRRRVRRVQVVITERERQNGKAGFASVALLGEADDGR